MKYIKMLLKDSPKVYLTLGILGIANSLWATFLLILLNSIVNPKKTFPTEVNPLILYFSLILISYLTSRYFQSFLIKITSKSSYDFQQMIFQNIRFSYLGDFEKIGSARIYTALSDARTISGFPQFFVETFNSFMYIICGIVYLFYISPITATLITVIIIVLAFRYISTNKAIEIQSKFLRDLEDDYYRSIDDFIRGFKQIKMSTTRNENLFSDFLDKNRKVTMSVSTKISLANLNNNLLGYYSWYSILGIVIFFISKYFNLSGIQLTSYLISILFLMSPLISMIRLLPAFTRMKVSLDRLDKFMNMIGGLAVNSSPKKNVQERFHSLRLQNVSYIYDSAEVETFHLGPLDFELERGTIVFITGGNGSGKSTFINILTGLYKPSNGRVFLNDTEIVESNYDHFRNQISCVFADHHLFSDNYDKHNFDTITEELKTHIQLLKMEGLIEVKKNKINTKLSKGQQKRLALIFALLENKELIVLDEWAAEQDPEFRNYFYKTLLPVLKASGKTIVAVTHDDNFYQYADRIIHFGYGKIITHS